MALDSDTDKWLPRPGDIIAERYEIERVIGRGGMAAVVSARHVMLGERVAIKFLHPDLAADVDNLERFFREAKAASRVRSEHVIRVFDVGVKDSRLPFIVMDLLAGMDLADLLARGPLAIQLAADCVLQAAEGLAEAHTAGIVHRDIKPSNLWLSHRPDGTALVKILDFGISKLAVGDGDARLTSTSAAFGSPAYMSPEQIRSAKTVDHRTDIWALGVVLFELLTGRLPFDAESAALAFAAIMRDAPLSARALRPDIPPVVEQLIGACLNKDPGARPSMRTLAQGLRPFASPAGQLSADRIARISRPSFPELDPSLRQALTPPSVAFAATAPAAMTVGRVPRRNARATRLALIAAGLFVLTAGITVVALATFGRRTVTSVTSSTAPSVDGDRRLAEKNLAPSASVSTTVSRPGVVPAESVAPTAASSRRAAPPPRRPNEASPVAPASDLPISESRK